jgi:hypothetical protein
MKSNAVLTRVKEVDWVGFEPTTSALLGASLSKGAASRKYHLIVQIPPAPFSLHAMQYSVPSGEVLRNKPIQ